MLDIAYPVKHTVNMNRLPLQKRVQVIAALTEGNSIRSTVRMTGVAKNTITKLVAELGPSCAQFMDRTLRNLPCKRVQCDETWSFCYAKQKNVPEPLKGQFGYGDVWTWVAMDADTKLICSWLVGGRDAGAASEFIRDLAGRLAHRVQLTTDGLRLYVNAVEDAFGSEIDYAMLVKIYGRGGGEAERRYGPATIIGTQAAAIIGDPNPKHVSTSYVERQNLTMRMSMRRFTRLTNGFSKKIANHIAAIAIHYMHYNFCRIHQSLRVTPAMAVGVSDHVWDIDDVVRLLDVSDAHLAA